MRSVAPGSLFEVTPQTVPKRGHRGTIAIVGPVWVRHVRRANRGNNTLLPDALKNLQVLEPI